MSLTLGKRIIPGVTKAPNSSQPIFASTGEINASSMKDVIAQMAQIMTIMASASYAADKETVEARREALKERNTELQAAFADKSGDRMAVIGATIAAEIEETSVREGFCRHLLIQGDIPQGDQIQITVKEKQALAYVMSSNSMVRPVEVRERRLMLNDFDINASILITNREINRANSDLLEEKYEETLEAIMVQEDRFYKKLATKAAGARYNIQSFSAFQPTYFARMRDLIDREGLATTTCVMASTLMKDIISTAEWQGIFSPVTQHEVMQTGELGQLYGVRILSDAIRQPNFRVLEDGEVFFVAPPINHGVILTRPLQAEPIDRYNHLENKRGWFFSQTMCMAVINALSTVKGFRFA